MILQKYESYKDSGVEWLGEILEDWEDQRLKTFFNQFTEYSMQSETKHQ